jgi:DNA-binding NtrC family response regulator
VGHEDAVRVLIVDDHRSTREALVRALAERAWHACGASDTDGAKAAVHAADWDLVVSDLRLGGESGLGLVRYLRGQYPGLRVCLMTGSVLTEQELGETAQLAVTVLTKPVTAPRVMALCRPRWQAQSEEP